jgi:hypothetical protein
MSDDFKENATQAKVIPVFFTEAVEMTFKSKEAGRPIYEDQEFVKILIPGDRNSSPVQPVNDEVKARWPKEYAAFTANQEAPLDGTPLSQWPPMKRAQVEEFRHFHVMTVEHLAAVNDSQLQHMPMGSRDLRKAAQVFLDAARNGTGPLMKLVAENTRMTDRIAANEATIADLAARLNQMEQASAGSK